MKTCTKCSTRKAEEDFHWQNRAKDKRQDWCKACMALYREAHRAEKHAYDREYYATHKNAWRAYQVKKAYGLSLEEWDAMLVAQCGRCGVCNEPMIGPKEPVVDHDHKTGAIRELLCQSCNRSIGLMKESPERFRAAILYLEKHKE